MLKKKQKIFYYFFMKEVSVVTRLTHKRIHTSIFNRSGNSDLNTFFFKKLAFIGLAINGIYFKKYYLATMKSTMFSA
jgi:hypothetical protein